MDSGNARSHRDGGGPARFSQKNGLFLIFAKQILGLPRPAGTPLINAGGKGITFFDSLRDTSKEVSLQVFFSMGSFAKRILRIGSQRRGAGCLHGKKPGADDQSAPGSFRKEKRGKKMKVHDKGCEIGFASACMYIITESLLKINSQFIKNV